MDPLHFYLLLPELAVSLVLTESESPENSSGAMGPTGSCLHILAARLPASSALHFHGAL